MPRHQRVNDDLLNIWYGCESATPDRSAAPVDLKAATSQAGRYVN